MSEQKPVPTIDPRFIIDRQGKSYCLYAGVLDLAHQQGLKAIKTDLVELGTEENGQRWLFRAVVETERGIFTGYGDASPSNVARAMLNVLPRLAETRAKARALRDAVNVGTASVEELGDDDDRAVSSADSPRGAAPPQPAHPVAPTPKAVSPAASAAPPTTQPLATPAQVRAIFGIAHDTRQWSEKDTEERVATRYGVSVDLLSRKQASEIIESLKKALPEPS